MKISLKKIFESGSIIDHQPDPKSSRKWMGSMSEKFIIVDAQNAADIITIYVKPIKEKQEFVGEDFGTIEIKKIKAHYGKCLGGYRVSFSDAESGWGPILYEIALEIATNLSVGLTSDRLSVSVDADRVWDKFMTRKNYPVNIIQLDDINADQDEKLTPNDYTDDCIMPDGGDSIAIKKLKNLHTKKMIRKSIFSKNNNLLQKKDPLNVNKIEKGSLSLLDSLFSPLSNIENEKQEYLNNPLTKLYQSYSYGIPTIDSLIRSKKIFFSPNAAFIIKKLRLEPNYDSILKSNNVHENKRYKLKKSLYKKVNESSGGMIDQEPRPGSSRKWSGSFEDSTRCLINVSESGKRITVYLSDKDGWLGEIEAKKVSNAYGPCLGAFRVSWADANKGWGPILYEVVLELATLLSNGLMPDRGSVSSDAQNIWDKFMTRNNYRVKIIQLDDKNARQDEKLTPADLTDDCEMPSDGDAPAVRSLVLLYQKKIKRELERKPEDQEIKEFSPLSNIEDEREEYLINPLTKAYQSYGMPTITRLIQKGVLYLTKKSTPLLSKLPFPANSQKFIIDHFDEGQINYSEQFIIPRQNESKIRLKNFLFESKMPEDIKSYGFYVQIEDTSYKKPGAVEISIIKAGESETLKAIIKLKPTDKQTGNCGNSFEVELAYIIDTSMKGQGWGQFLYTLALEYASSRGMSLVSDRLEVSAEAQKMWASLNAKKSTGAGQRVVTKQLDDKNSQEDKKITPYLYDDDCSHQIQLFGQEIPNYEEDSNAFLASPLTKSYRVNSDPTIKKLKKLGLLKEI
jgi:hypothetical protein